MRKLKKTIALIYFQIGVNVIGLPDFHLHDLRTFPIQKSKFIK